MVASPSTRAWSEARGLLAAHPLLQRKNEKYVVQPCYVVLKTTNPSIRRRRGNQAVSEQSFRLCKRAEKRRRGVRSGAASASRLQSGRVQTRKGLAAYDGCAT